MQLVTALRSQPQRRFAGIVFEVGTWLALAPVLLLSHAFSWGVLLAVGLVLVLRYGLGSKLLPKPLRGPLILWLPLFVLSLVIAIQPDAAWFRGWAYLFGVLTLSMVYDLGRERRAVWWLVGIWLAGGVAIACIGLIGTAWQAKLPFLQALYARLPGHTFTVRASFEHQEGLNANGIAGTLLTFLYVPLALAADRPTLQQTWFWRRVGLLLIHIALAGVLFLTQSRGGYLAAVLGYAALLALRWPRVLWLVPLGVGLGLMAHAQVGALVAQVPWQPLLSGRFLIWQRAWYLVQDFPFTGVGLNMFAPVSARLYPTFLGAERLAVHAHNLLLQLALDFGVFGVAAFAWLLSRVFRAGLRGIARAHGQADRSVAWTLRGLLAGQIAYLVFSLTDVTNLGSRQGFVFWAAWALILRLGQEQPGPTSEASA